MIYCAVCQHDLQNSPVSPRCRRPPAAAGTCASGTGRSGRSALAMTPCGKSTAAPHLPPPAAADDSKMQPCHIRSWSRPQDSWVCRMTSRRRGVTTPGHPGKQRCVQSRRLRVGTSVATICSRYTACSQRVVFRKQAGMCVASQAAHAQATSFCKPVSCWQLLQWQ